MAINSMIGEFKPQKEKLFPKLMICKKDGFTTIVAFTEPGKGIQLYSNHIGNHRFQMKETDRWKIEDFNDFNDPITLQND